MTAPTVTPNSQPMNWRDAIVAFVQDVDVSLPLLVALVLGVTWLWLLFRARRQPRTALEGRWRLFVAALAIACVVISVVNHSAPVTARWRWNLAAFPTIIVLAHGFALFRLRRLDMSKASAQDTDDPALAQIRRSVSRDFGALTLIVRYGIPAFFIAWIGLGMTNALFRELKSPEGWPLSTVIAAAYGLAGSYSYVVLYLGYRSFRYDITPGSAMWCAVTLAVGPLIAGVFGMFWPPVKTLLTPNESQIFRVATFFFVGFSPRYGIGVIEEIARSGWKSVHRDETDNSRTLPITQLPGVTPNIAERLAEEGLTSVEGMAGADPVRLLRSTRYDKSLIVDWIDTAMLMQALPKDWEKLQSVGISKATDLAALAPTKLEQPPAVVSAEQTAPAKPPTQAAEPDRLRLSAGTLAQLATIASVHPLVVETKAEMFVIDPNVRMLALVRQLRFESETDGD